MLPYTIRPPIIILSPPPPPTPPLTPSGSLESSFPIVTISIIGILATAILLMSYYAFVTKCCLNWQQSNTISHIYQSHRRRRSHHSEDIFTLQYSVMLGDRGLDELTIQAIPTFRYRRDQVQGSSNDCAVCLNDFKEEERVRLLPNCLHGFHIDCIDAWLQTHANCPLCRSEITTAKTLPINSNIDEIPSQNSAEMESIVIEVRDDEAQISNDDGYDERLDLRNWRKKPYVSSMGDECIDSRSKEGEFGVQPMRRSFSMDSSNNRQLYIAVQEILQKNPNFQMASSGEESSSGSSARVRRSFFSFGHSRSSKNAVLPIQNEL
ncbi:RING-H2 finger protein ATL1-like [Dendrobium catenatum]|uniref:RING-type E3 ubiquitin transferase n=1 Tax=Dendrobium catenatum TaxID=906689 RepID=A0A2I0X4N4_9ASPA|nr:RING-H2 finger protein ATL1-like [Dendrobium catenatum]PKU82879.1 RING-H2 finger protein ATL1 [Dendrobium catenatum]